MFCDILMPYFSKYNRHFSKSLLNFCESMFFSASSNSWEVARKMSAIKNLNFKATEMRRYRLLSNDNFVVDDAIFRCNINILMDSLEQNNIISENDKLLVSIDYTTIRNKYLILDAALIIRGHSYPIYLSLRNYSKRKVGFDPKKMERSFIKSLKHLLSKRFSYILTADCGFGNKRFIDLCEENDFEYIISIMPNMNGKYDESDIVRDLFDSPCMQRIDDSKWFLVSNIKDLSHVKCSNIYEKRFEIEKTFQNLKSSGFDIENSKINQYSKFKRLLFCCFLSYNILTLLGNYINTRMHHFKKNALICEGLILAYLLSHEKLLPISIPKLNKS